MKTHNTSAVPRSKPDRLWHVQGLFADERMAWDALAALEVHGFGAREIEILDRMTLPPGAPPETWPHFEWSLAGGVLLALATAVLLGFSRPAIIAAVFAGAVALGALIGTRAARAEEGQLRAMLARGGALLSVGVHDTDGEHAARKTLSRFHPVAIQVRGWAG